MKLNDEGIWEWIYKPRHNKDTGYDDVIKSYNIISVEDFKSLDEKEQQHYVKEVIALIRQRNIYPIYYYTEDGIKEEIIKAILHEPTVPNSSINEYGRAGATMLDFLFPNLHLVDAGTSVNNKLYHRFFDDTKLNKCITRHMKNYKFTSMRTPFFMYGRYFWNTAMNFSPMRAKAIYARFCKRNDRVYDFSAGFGSRMLGALSNINLNLTYVACEPNVNTFYNLKRLGRYIESVTQRQGSYELYQTGSEVLQLPEASIDFAFSCPPYYGLERYGDEDTQSFVKFPIYEDWNKWYALVTLTNVYKALRPGALMGYVINNVWYKNIYYDLVKDWGTNAKAVGFKPVDVIPIRSTSRKQNVESLHLFRKEE